MNADHMQVLWCAIQRSRLASHFPTGGDPVKNQGVLIVSRSRSCSAGPVVVGIDCTLGDWRPVPRWLCSSWTFSQTMRCYPLWNLCNKTVHARWVMGDFEWAVVEGLEKPWKSVTAYIVQLSESHEIIKLWSHVLTVSGNMRTRKFVNTLIQNGKMRTLGIVARYLTRFEFYFIYWTTRVVSDV